MARAEARGERAGEPAVDVGRIVGRPSERGAEEEVAFVDAIGGAGDGDFEVDLEPDAGRRDDVVATAVAERRSEEDGKSIAAIAERRDRRRPQRGSERAARDAAGAERLREACLDRES